MSGWRRGAGAAAAPKIVQELLEIIRRFNEAGVAVVIVDQHSAHERVLYETTMAQLTGMPQQILDDRERVDVGGGVDHEVNC